MSKTNIQVSRATRDALASLGAKGDSYDDIISSLLHQRNVFFIHSLCRGQYLSDGVVTLKERCIDVFRTIRFEIVPPYFDGGLNGSNEWKEWDSFEDALEWAVEMATDEDLIGSNNDNLSMGEAVTNVYCLMNGIDAPTWSMGKGMKNPFSL